jgi:hypothetical protein
MKSSVSLKQKLSLAVTDARLFFSTCLSMHIVPVVFALVFIVVAQKNNQNAPMAVKQKSVAATKSISAPSFAWTLVHAARPIQVVALYKVATFTLQLAR